jgi:integrase/recombinase XerD
MFDQVFHYEFWRRKYTKGNPFVRYLDPFAELLFQRGHNRLQVLTRFGALRQFGAWLKRNKLKVQHMDEEMIRKYMREEKRPYPGRDWPALNLFLQMLRRNGVVSAPKRKKTHTEKLLDEFRLFLVSDRGVVNRRTDENYKKICRRFIHHTFGNAPLNWERIGSEEIYRFLTQEGERYSRATVRGVGSALRVFFRFLAMKGMARPELASAVPSVRTYRAANLPYYLNAKEVQQLLDTVDSSTIVGKRDYALLLLLSRLGLRACEVTSLTLDDVDWRNGEIIVQGKGFAKKRLPISREVGSAIASYLKIRRKDSGRALFLITGPPYHGVSSGVINWVVKTAVVRAGLKPYKSGSHLLRHTAATQMLRRGASLREVGTILGHLSDNHTAIYAKVDFANLIPVAQPWPRVSCHGGVR